MQDDIFLWNWKVYSWASSFFWFCTDEAGNFGYRMESNPDHFEKWSEEEARRRLHTFVKHTPRTEILGPYISEIPPLILKIRVMEQRHKRYIERKQHV